MDVIELIPGAEARLVAVWNVRAEARTYLRSENNDNSKNNDKSKCGDPSRCSE
jgi:hypothetical protein